MSSPNRLPLAEEQVYTVLRIETAGRDRRKMIQWIVMLKKHCMVVESHTVEM